MSYNRNLYMMKLLKRLAEKSKNGIENFKDATQETWDEKLFYDETTVDKYGNYKLVKAAYIFDDPECLHHDVLDYYPFINVRIDDVEPYVTTTWDREKIVIKNGEWTFVK